MVAGGLFLCLMASRTPWSPQCTLQCTINMIFSYLTFSVQVCNSSIGVELEVVPMTLVPLMYASGYHEINLIFLCRCATA